MSLDLPGFADPVLGAQRAFRAVLEAMSHPGRVVAAGFELTPPAPLVPSAAAVLLALVDQDTVLHLSPGAEAATDWLQFHTGAALGEVSQADFVLALSCPDLAALPAGTDDAPELGATVILQIEAFGSGRRFVLEGPGLERPTSFAASGLPDDFARSWAANHARYPRGVDLILCAGGELAVLPRSIRVREG